MFRQAVYCLSGVYMEESLRKKKAMYRQIFVLTWPIVIQNLLNAAVNSADVIMLNYVGQDSLAAGSLAAQYTSLIFMLFYGIGTGVTMLCAQYYGKGDMVAVHKVEGIALRFSIIISFICSCLGFFCPEVIMRIFTNEEALITLGAEYLRIVAPCFVLWGITEAYKAVLRSVGRVTIITVINGIALSLNIFLNAVFIFGLFGLPQMGIRGVALATALARLIELLIAIGISLTSKDAKMVIKPIFQKNPLLMKDFLTMALPAIGNDMIWNLAFAMYSVIIGHLGSDVVAANSIVSVVRNLGCVFCYAIAASSGILVGQVLGENRIEDGRELSLIHI